MGRRAGLGLSLALAVATLALAATGRLDLYLHPRTTAFAVLMALVALAAGVAARGRADEPDGHGHEADDPGHEVHQHEPEHEAPSRGRAVLGAALAVLVAAALLVLPPRTLSATTAGDRVDDAFGFGDSGLTLDGADPSTFTVKDWAELIRSGTPLEALQAQEPTILGFVMADPRHEDRFLLARYYVTCCAVDARPMGVTVVEPGWRDAHPEGTWLEVTGRFAPGGGAEGDPRAVLEPSAIAQVPEPEEPYVY